MKKPIEVPPVFTLTDKEFKKKKQWYKKLIKDHPDLFGKEHNRYPQIQYVFTPTGIGNGVELVEIHTNKRLDITDYKSW